MVLVLSLEELPVLVAPAVPEDLEDLAVREVMQVQEVQEVQAAQEARQEQQDLGGLPAREVQEDLEVRAVQQGQQGQGGLEDQVEEGAVAEALRELHLLQRLKAYLLLPLFLVAAVAAVEQGLILHLIQEEQEVLEECRLVALEILVLQEPLLQGDLEEEVVEA